MNKPFKVSSTTAEVSVVTILSGSPPAIKVMYCAENSRGAARQFARQIPVLDANLFQRIQANVEVGDRIQVTTVNEWYDNGYQSYLADFAKTNSTEPKNQSKILEVSR